MTRINIPYTNEKIILVDPEDHIIGEAEKILCHEYAMLHRAFSAFVFRKKLNKIEVLLQRRNKKKYHSGGLWTNACCGHPHIGENLIQAAQKRLHEEMGIHVQLHEVGKFHYVAPFGNGLTENEIDHVLIGTYDEENIPFNKDEVEEYAWEDIHALKKTLKSSSSAYTAWFSQAFEIACKHLSRLTEKASS